MGGSGVLVVLPGEFNIYVATNDGQVRQIYKVMRCQSILQHILTVDGKIKDIVDLC